MPKAWYKSVCDMAETPFVVGFGHQTTSLMPCHFATHSLAGYAFAG